MCAVVCVLVAEACVFIVNRVTDCCMDNLEMLGILLKVREVFQGKNLVREKWPKTVYC